MRARVAIFHDLPASRETFANCQAKEFSHKSAPAERGPFSLFENFRRTIDQTFDDFNPLGWRTCPNACAPSGMPSLERAAWHMSPVVDVIKSDKKYKITAEMPGMDANEVEVKVANGLLSVSGEKRRKGTQIGQVVPYEGEEIDAFDIAAQAENCTTTRHPATLVRQSGGCPRARPPTPAIHLR
ncbi:Hsp20/alpha crystallin family protein (plasmid) [Sinorhizobium chiapasense]|uniref:Hsp20/alpha crystallin family protein n=1 Tax=Sinorhizobium chiapasense TaxID=501572 RepID=UPI002FE018B9